MHKTLKFYGTHDFKNHHEYISISFRLSTLFVPGSNMVEYVPTNVVSH